MNDDLAIHSLNKVEGILAHDEFAENFVSIIISSISCRPFVSQKTCYPSIFHPIRHVIAQRNDPRHGVLINKDSHVPHPVQQLFSRAHICTQED